MAKSPRARPLAAFGLNVRQRREALGLSQLKAAEKADLDPTYIRGIERGVAGNLGGPSAARLAQPRPPPLLAKASRASDGERADISVLDRLLIESKNMVKSMTTHTDSVWFTTKGQVVIPAKLRRQFHIQDGTRAIVEATPEGILLKPVTKHAIARLRGILKRKPGDKPFAEEWAEHQAAEKALEEAKDGRRPGSR